MIGPEDPTQNDPTPSPPEHFAEQEGQTIDRYKLVSELGKGGFGVVWLAQQTAPVRRRVALKIIKPGMDSESILTRFTAERQALASMDHPCIARMLDAGATPKGRPYFVMEYVDGERISDFCRAQGLSVDDRIRLFIRVCDAVQHAHHKGVIHRDLKPANILAFRDAEGEPTPRVIDFGVAKALGAAAVDDQTAVTLEHQIIGTPAYMSPEQADAGGASVDTRSDVYSLGVVLYEILTGDRPLHPDRVAPAELGRWLRTTEPDRPSTRVASSADSKQAIPGSTREQQPRASAKRLRGDLDWIVMKALEKDPARRYQSVGEFAADLRRHLNNEPVSAGPPSPSYVVAKFVRRHRTAVGATSAVVVAVLAGLVATTAFAIQASRARDQARAISLELHQVAEFQSEMLSDVNPQRLGNTLAELLRNEASGDPASSEALKQVLRGVNTTNIASTMLDKEILGRAQKVIETRFADQPLVRARLLFNVSDALTSLGLFERALPLQEKSLALFREQLGPEDPISISALVNKGVLLKSLARFHESLACYDEALSLARGVYGDIHTETAIILDNRGVLLLAMGKPSDAAASHREALARFEKTLGKADDRTIRSMGNLASALMDTGEIEEAELFARDAVTLAEQNLEPNHPSIQTWRGNLAALLYRQGRYEESVEISARVVDTQRKTLGDRHPDTIQTMSNLGSAQQRAGDLEGAITTFRAALGLAEESLPRNDPLTLLLLDNLAYPVELSGGLEEAEAMYRRVIDGRRQILGPRHPDTLVSLNNLGVMLREAGRYGEALTPATEAATVALDALGSTHPYAVRFTQNVATIYDKWEASDAPGFPDQDAELWRSRAAELSPEQPEPDQP